MTNAMTCTPTNRNGIRIKSRVKAGRLAANHNQAARRARCRA